MLSLPPAAFLGSLALYIEYNGTYFYFTRTSVKKASLPYLWEVWTPWERVSFFEGEEFYLRIFPNSKCDCEKSRLRRKRAPFLPPPGFMAGSVLFFSNDFSYDVSTNRFHGKRGRGALIYQDDYLRVFYDPAERDFRGFFLDRKKDCFKVILLTERVMVFSENNSVRSSRIRSFQKERNGWREGPLSKKVLEKVKMGYRFYTYLDSLYFYNSTEVKLPWGTFRTGKELPDGEIELVSGTYFLPILIMLDESGESCFFLTPKKAEPLRKILYGEAHQ